MFWDLLESPAMANSVSERILVPADTRVTAKGDGPAVEFGDASNRVFLVTLSITKIIEQEALDVSIYGSTDGAAWTPKSIAAFPQQFYTGEWPLLLDLSAQPEVTVVGALGEVTPWGRAPGT